MYIAKGETPCQTNTAELWFPVQADTKNGRIAVALCKICPERKDCLLSTLRFERREGAVQPAIFGGKTPGQRRAMLAKKYLQQANESESA